MSRGVEFGYLEEESMATNSTLVRVNKDVLATLHQLSEQQGLPMQEIVGRAVEHYRRELFFAQAQEALARLQADDGAWRAYQQEIADLDAVAGDGLVNDEYPEYAAHVTRSAAETRALPPTSSQDGRI
jgi:predicted DNA-binding protein